MRPIHWIIVLVVVLVLFGAQKLAKSIGQSAKILKKEMNDLSEDTPSSDENSTTK